MYATLAQVALQSKIHFLRLQHSSLSSEKKERNMYLYIYIYKKGLDTKSEHKKSADGGWARWNVTP